MDDAREAVLDPHLIKDRFSIHNLYLVFIIIIIYYYI